MEYPARADLRKNLPQYHRDRSFIFHHIHRLIRSIIDGLISRGDAVSARNSLELAQSLAARVWANTPLELRQMETLGSTAVRKLSAAGINSIEALAATSASRIDAILSRHPPYGHNLLKELRDFPKLTLTATLQTQVG